MITTPMPILGLIVIIVTVVTINLTMLINIWIISAGSLQVSFNDVVPTDSICPDEYFVNRA